LQVTSSDHGSRVMRHHPLISTRIVPSLNGTVCSLAVAERPGRTSPLRCTPSCADIPMLAVTACSRTGHSQTTHPPTAVGVITTEAEADALAAAQSAVSHDTLRLSGPQRVRRGEPVGNAETYNYDLRPEIVQKRAAASTSGAPAAVRRPCSQRSNLRIGKIPYAPARGAAATVVC
jgi:hypothetical protein